MGVFRSHWSAACIERRLRRFVDKRGWGAISYLYVALAMGAGDETERVRMTAQAAQTTDSSTERLVRVEEAVANIKENMATRADIEGVKTLIAEKESVQTRWLLGIMAAAAVAVVVALIRTFM